MKIVQMAVEDVKTEIAHLMASDLVPERKHYSSNKDNLKYTVLGELMWYILNEKVHCKRNVIAFLVSNNTAPPRKVCEFC